MRVVTLTNIVDVLSVAVGGMRVRRRVESLMAASALLSVSSCMTVSASVVPTAAGGVPEAVEKVRVSALGVPDGARELGLVEAHSAVAPLERIVDEVKQRAAAMGANLICIDKMATRYEWINSMCGNQPCRYEAGTLSVLGHAYRFDKESR